uniref:Vomeronasal type-1 receptor n=1 Tax=Sus scrofa TaxID=9823 RepID=A0A8D1JXC4_PIG
MLRQANLEMEILFLTQTGAGILGNSSLLCLYNLTLLTGSKMRPTDQIANQLTRAAFGMKCFPDEAGCKLVFCLHRVARGVSISTTCLLSGFQALKFCSRNSWWIDFRIQCLKSIGFCSFLFWILQLVVNVCVPIRITGPRSGKNINVKTYYGYCSSLTPDKFMRLSRAVVLVLVDVVCLGCVIWTRGYMLFVLHRHKQKVQHIHSKTFPQTFPRGQSYMILVSRFVYCYCTSSILTLCVTLIVNPNQWLRVISVLLASCLSAFSPFVLLSSDSRVSHSFLDFCTRKTVSSLSSSTVTLLLISAVDINNRSIINLHF